MKNINTTIKKVLNDISSCTHTRSSFYVRVYTHNAYITYTGMSEK